VSATVKKVPDGNVVISESKVTLKPVIVTPAPTVPLVVTPPKIEKVKSTPTITPEEKKEKSPIKEKTDKAKTDKAPIVTPPE
jgi:hypothetical protein